MKIKTKIEKFINSTYDVKPDYPFEDEYADCAVFRHLINNKWFALYMNIDYTKLGINKIGKCEILNLKCNPHTALFLREEPGILPAYHMNKTHWNTVLLDGTVEIEKIYEMIRESYSLIAPKRKKK